MKKIKTISHDLFRVLRISLYRLFREHYTYRASALAFTTLLTLVPLLSVILSLITLLPFFSKFVDLAQTYILTNFIPTSSVIIQKYLQGFVEQAARLPKIGIAFLFLTAVMLMITVDHILNDIWRITKRRKKASSILMYWILLLLSPIVIGLGLFLSSAFFSLSWIAKAANELNLMVPLLASLPLVINTCIFTALYIVVPNCRVNWRDGFTGGFIAAILFELAKSGFAYYIVKFPSYERIYGTFATIPIFLVWLYISWMIVLFGALVSYEKNQLRVSR